MPSSGRETLKSPNFTLRRKLLLFSIIVQYNSFGPQVKVNFSLCLTEYHDLKPCPVHNKTRHHEDALGVEVQRYLFLTSALEIGKWSASGPGLFITRETAPGTHWTGGLMGSRVGLTAMEKR